MNQRRVRRGLLPFLPLVAVIAFGFQNCSQVSLDASESLRSMKVVELDSVPTILCPTPSEIVAMELQFSGPTEVEQGEKAQYYISSVPDSCLEGSVVNWFTSEELIPQEAISPALESAGGFEHIFKRPGVYVVGVRFLDSSLKMKQATQRVLVREKCENANCESALARSVVLGPTVVVANMNSDFSVSGKLLSSDPVWSFQNTGPVGNGFKANLTVPEIGINTLSAAVLNASRNSVEILHEVSVLAVEEAIVADSQPRCDLSVLDLTGPSVLGKNEAGLFQIVVPACAGQALESISWSIDNTDLGVGQASKHIASDQLGSHFVRASLRVKNSETVISLSRHLTIVEHSDPSIGGPEPTPGPMVCGPVPEGGSLDLQRAMRFEEESCGTDGKKTVSLQDTDRYTCTSSVLRLVDTRTTRVGESACRGQACQLPDGTSIKNGESQTLFSETRPVGSCADVQSIRSCVNGVLSGTSSATHRSCSAGCIGHGRDGDTWYVVSGEVSIPKQCQYGETGIVDVHQQESLRSCRDGQVDAGDTVRMGSRLKEGVCPTYSWVQTGWSACDKDCGGMKSAIHSCKNASGSEVVSGDRCGAEPAVKEICDGNPDLRIVRDTPEQAGASKLCPSNQIGVIMSERTKTTTTVCVDHQLKDETTYSDWTTRNYCTKYVAARCSHDSLSPQQALGRYAWMKSCSESVPAFADFFTELKGKKESPETIFENTYKVAQNGTVDFGRMTYATFVTADGKPWIAPAPGTTDYNKRLALPDVSGISCELPATARVSAVCLSSCFTPEQQLLVDIETRRSVSFVDALLESQAAAGADFVATLSAESTIQKPKFKNSPIDRIVTELFDSTHQMLRFRTESGAKVELTPNHPVVSAAGEIIEAKDWKVGDSLIRSDGQMDKIKEIDGFWHEGKVYNVFVKSNDPKQNVVVVQDVMVGTGFFQNEGAEFLNQKVLRTNLTRPKK